MTGCAAAAAARATRAAARFGLADGRAQREHDDRQYDQPYNQCRHIRLPPCIIE